MWSELARKVSFLAGSSVVFAIAVVIILIWGIAGPLFHFSDTWQLIINTGTTIVTFLMVFLIQNTQNHDTAAIQKKLDTLIAGVDKADNRMIGLEKREINDAK